jgi:hypothetical protein
MDHLAHPLLIGWGHVLEVNDTPAFVAAALGAKFRDALFVFLVLVSSTPDVGRILAIGAHNYFDLHPGVVAAAAKALQWPALVALILASFVIGQSLFRLTGKCGGILKREGSGRINDLGLQLLLPAEDLTAGTSDACIVTIGSPEWQLRESHSLKRLQNRRQGMRVKTA